MRSMNIDKESYTKAKAAVFMNGKQSAAFIAQVESGQWWHIFPIHSKIFSCGIKIII